jgi:hypothetical protein
MAQQFICLVILPPQLEISVDFAATAVMDGLFRNYGSVCSPGKTSNPRYHHEPRSQRFTLPVLVIRSPASSFPSVVKLLIVKSQSGPNSHCFLLIGVFFSPHSLVIDYCPSVLLTPRFHTSQLCLTILGVGGIAPSIAFARLACILVRGCPFGTSR